MFRSVRYRIKFFEPGSVERCALFEGSSAFPGPAVGEQLSGSIWRETSWKSASATVASQLEAMTNEPVATVVRVLHQYDELDATVVTVNVYTESLLLG